MSATSLDSFLSCSKPIGKGVTQVTFPSQNKQWVIKFARVHDPAKFDSFGFALGWDGLRDQHVNAHSERMERLVQDTLSRSPYCHVPKVLHTTFMSLSEFPAKYLDQVPDDFLCKHQADVMVRVIVQERVHGLTLADAIETMSHTWCLDDWKSLLAQIACSLCQLQQNLGYVQFDSHAQNIMIEQLEAPTSISYMMNDVAVVTPPSRLLIKWIDTSSALVCGVMKKVEARRACAQRAWFNLYVRSYFKVVDFVVPTGACDWLNVMASILRMIESRCPDVMLSYLKLVIEKSVTIAFSHAYGRMMSSEAIDQSVQVDQKENLGWTLPHSFWDCDGTIMEQICRCIFASMMRPAAEAKGLIVEIPVRTMPGFAPVEHDIVMHMRSVANSISCYLSFAMAPEKIMELEWFRGIVHRYVQGEWFVPVMRRSQFSGIDIKTSSCMMKVLQGFPVVERSSSPASVRSQFQQVVSAFS